MEIGSAARFASDNAMAKVQGSVAITMHKKILDIAEANMQQLLAAVPAAPTAVDAGKGNIVNTTA
ncbi:MAG: putative motility protein [Rhodocyclaceae bacterium]|nr:putative motility protein [Rhodocyclaceae bacterium]